MVKRMITFQFTPPSGVGLDGDFFEFGGSGGCCSDMIKYRQPRGCFFRCGTLTQENGMEIPFFGNSRQRKPARIQPGGF